LLELGIKDILETGIWKVLGISNFTDLRQTRIARMIPQSVLETTFKIEETTYVFFSFRVKPFLFLFGATQFSVFLASFIEDYL
jgi:hypothetical protein